VVEYPPSRDDPPGFGRRDSRGSFPLRPGDVARLHAKPSLAIGLLFFGLFWSWVVIAAVVRDPRDVDPFGFVVALAAAVSLLLAGGWTLVVPLVVLRDAHLRLRWASPWPVQHEIDAVDVDWRVGRQRIGPRLRATNVNGRAVRIPVWALRRPDAERLFDWLDDVVARGPVASPAPPEARR
jgi:hypothetical protein